MSVPGEKRIEHFINARWHSSVQNPLATWNSRKRVNFRASLCLKALRLTLRLMAKYRPTAKCLYLDPMGERDWPVRQYANPRPL